MRLTPRGGRERIDGWARDAEGQVFLKVRVAAPPVEGEANDALVRFIAKSLARPPSAVRILAGQGARLKQLEVDGVDETDLTRAFGPPPT